RCEELAFLLRPPPPILPWQTADGLGHQIVNEHQLCAAKLHAVIDEAVPSACRAQERTRRRRATDGQPGPQPELQPSSTASDEDVLARRAQRFRLHAYQLSRSAGQAKRRTIQNESHSTTSAGRTFPSFQVVLR